MKNEIVYLLKVREEAPLLKKEYQKEYEALCSTIHWQFLQAENLEFDVENVDVVLKDDWIKDYFAKYFNYDIHKICSLLIEFMKADLLTMGATVYGK